MHRFYAEPDPADSGQALLSEEDQRHARKVLRLHAGDPVEVFLNESVFSAVLMDRRDGRLVLRLDRQLPSSEPVLQITLFQGIPKSDKMDWIVQKAVELGVRRIVPVRMLRCVSRPDPDGDRHKAERWQKIAREACKQSGRAFIPPVDPPLSFSALPQEVIRLDACAVPWEEHHGRGPLSFVRNFPAPESLGIIIGPEGGIDSTEIAVLKEAGCTPVTLGKRILRTETAGLAAVSAFMALYGEME